MISVTVRIQFVYSSPYKDTECAIYATACENNEKCLVPAWKHWEAFGNFDYSQASHCRFGWAVYLIFRGDKREFGQKSILKVTEINFEGFKSVNWERSEEKWPHGLNFLPREIPSKANECFEANEWEFKPKFARPKITNSSGGNLVRKIPSDSLPAPNYGAIDFSCKVTQAFPHHLR